MMRVQVLAPTLTQADEAVKQIILTEEPPKTIQLAYRTISISDVTQDIMMNKEQEAILEHFDLSTPCALLMHPPLENENNTTQSYVQINIAKCGGGIKYPLEKNDAIRLVNQASLSVKNAGFQIINLPRETARLWFRRSIARLVDLRWEASEDENNINPPTELVEVHTKINKVNVIWANGYFININESFGRATPARNKLPYGYYTFGVFYNGLPDFYPNLYKIPVGEPIYLEKP